MKTINPFHNPQSAYSKTHFEYSGKCLFEHRGVQIYKSPEGSYDYTLEGMTITQRAGLPKTREGKSEIINNLLDGKSFEYRPAKVCEHLRKLGFTPLPYPETT